MSAYSRFFKFEIRFKSIRYSVHCKRGLRTTDNVNLVPNHIMTSICKQETFLLPDPGPWAV